ncbi:hypothetical protein GALMADRAFT_259986 [Galerina marginata CBS 339.88]|uniref:Uncharacterized protein n=1 Tax=Galerina marginata (strain CBS 339.88) TaxID=685588 RepID=A0A067S4Z9_GALM3|nr:hypothetical protein GALMADRAFT_259986 [Galerina marginata CBS 339.88]
MRTPQHLCVAILLLLLKYHEVLAFTVSVASNTASIGQTFSLSWTAITNDPQDADVCLSTNTEFLRIGTIHRANTFAGKVDVTVGSNISPGTYLLGIRVTGCAFLIGRDPDPNFVVTAAHVTSTSTTAQTSRSTSSSTPPHTSSKTSSTSTTPTSSATTSRSNSATQSDSTPQTIIKTLSSTSSGSTSQSQTSSQTSSDDSPTPTSADTSPTPSSGALGKAGALGKGMLVPFIGGMFGVVLALL